MFLENGEFNWFLKGKTRQVLAVHEVFEFAFSAKVLAEIRPVCD